MQYKRAYELMQLVWSRFILILVGVIVEWVIS